jgi:hypothetical protein
VFTIRSQATNLTDPRHVGPGSPRGRRFCS